MDNLAALTSRRVS